MDKQFDRMRDKLQELLLDEAWLLEAIAALDGVPPALPAPVDPRLGVPLLPRVGRNPHGNKKPPILVRDLNEVRRMRAPLEARLAKRLS